MAADRASRTEREEQLTPEAGRLIRFVLVGASNTVITLVTYAALVGLGVFYVVAGVVGWTLGILNGYFWNRTWTFQAGSHQHELLVKYTAVGLGGLCLNSGLLALAVDVIGVSKLAGQAAVLPVVLISSFAANRFWTFGEHLGGSPEPAEPAPVGAGHP